MLIRPAVLERIVGGEIDTQFRRQKKPTVKAGGTLRTHLGMLEIVEVSRIALDDVSDQDARRSGAADREQVIAELTRKADGDFYRVRLRYAGADPRWHSGRTTIVRRRCGGAHRQARPLRPQLVLGRLDARRCA